MAEGVHVAVVAARELIPGKMFIQAALDIPNSDISKYPLISKSINWPYFFLFCLLLFLAPMISDY